MDIAADFLAQGHRRVIYKINDVLEKHGAINSMHGRHFLYLNKSDRKLLHKHHFDQLLITIEPDLSKYGAKMPDSLAEALRLFPTAEQHFENLTPGKQRSIIFLIAGIKSESLQIKKAILCMEYLEAHQGNLDTRDLLAWMKGR